MNENLRQILPNPIETVKSLDTVIIGQLQAKKTLALMLFNRAMLRLSNEGYIDTDVRLQKSNVLLIGSTGVGKTSLIKALGDIADIPIHITDVTNLTGTGCVGDNLIDELVHHVNNTEEWLLSNEQRFLDEGVFTVGVDEPLEVIQQTAENGIICLDEIDKIAIRDKQKEEFSTGIIQNELLRMLEGNYCRFSTVNKLPCKLSGIDTTNLTFVCLGAFSGLQEIVYERLNKSHGVGFSSDLSFRINKEEDLNSLLPYVKTEDLIKYGFKAEFLGRITAKAVLQDLNLEMMEEIIVKPTNSVLKQYESMFKALDIELIVEKEAIQEIANAALKLKAGARSLKGLFDRIFTDYLYNVFEYQDKKLVITKSIIKEKCNL